MDLNSLTSNRSKSKQSVKDYITFVANYTCCILGWCWIKLIFKENLDKSIFDVLTVSDEAFAIILMENNTEKWTDQADKERELEENGFIAHPNDRSKPKMKKAKWTVTLKKRKNLLYVDNWSQEGKDRYNKLGKKLQKIHAGKSVHQPHVDAWHEWIACTNMFPTALSNDQNQETTYDADTHGRRNMTNEPAKLPLTATGDYDCTQIFET